MFSAKVVKFYKHNPPPPPPPPPLYPSILCWNWNEQNRLLPLSISFCYPTTAHSILAMTTKIKLKVVYRKVYNYIRYDLKEIKLKVVYRKVYDYIRYDLKEIIAPSSLPNPPWLDTRERPPRKLTFKQYCWTTKMACKLYAASWVRDIEPDLQRIRNKVEGNDESGRTLLKENDESDEVKEAKTEPQLSMFEELAEASKGGMETLRPALQRVYMTKASAYKDALRSFIQGYLEGVQDVREKKDGFFSELKDESAQKPK